MLSDGILSRIYTLSVSLFNGLGIASWNAIQSYFSSILLTEKFYVPSRVFNRSFKIMSCISHSQYNQITCCNSRNLGNAFSQYKLHPLTRKIIPLFFFLFTINLYAQDVPCDDMSSRDERKLERAKVNLEARNYIEAYDDLNRLYQKHPHCLSVLYFYGAISYALKKQDEAILSFEKVFERKPDYKPGLSYTLGRLYYERKNYQKAIPPLKYFVAHYKKSSFLNYAEKFLQLSQIRLQIKADSLLNFSPIKLPPAINTANHEYLPSLSADNKAIVFTRRVRGQEDIYMCTRDSTGRWREAFPLYGINTPRGNEGGHCFSADGRLLIFTYCNEEYTYGSCDLMIAFKQADGTWSSPRNLGREVNTTAWDSQPSLSPDKRILYFASTRDHRNSDIYYATLQSDGTYGDVKSMGSPINTAGNERTPFIAFDNETFYFSSDGHPGLGKRDIFISRKDSNGNWMQPKNLGPPLNSDENDGALFINSSATKAYFSSAKEGNVNIYVFHPDPSIAPQPVTYIEGVVYDSITRKRLIATVSVLRLRDSTMVSRFITNLDGYYLTCLPIGESYAFWVDKTGYIFYSSHVVLRNQKSVVSPMKLNIPLLSFSEIQGENTTITLKNVHFETGSSKLLPEAMPELNKLLKLLKNYPKISISIHGHTDNVGTEEDNLILSKNRANSVRQFLVKHGIQGKRIATAGFGESQPLVPNDSDAHRVVNRRTEVVIINNTLQEEK